MWKVKHYDHEGGDHVSYLFKDDEKFVRASIDGPGHIQFMDDIAARLNRADETEARLAKATELLKTAEYVCVGHQPSATFEANVLLPLIRAFLSTKPEDKMPIVPENPKLQPDLDALRIDLERQRKALTDTFDRLDQNYGSLNIRLIKIEREVERNSSTTPQPQEPGAVKIANLVIEKKIYWNDEIRTLARAYLDEHERNEKLVAAVKEMHKQYPYPKWLETLFHDSCMKVFRLLNLEPKEPK